MRRTILLLLVFVGLGFFRAQAQDTLKTSGPCGYRSLVHERAPASFPKIRLTRVMQVGGGIIIGLSPLFIDKIYVPGSTPEGRTEYDYSRFNRAIALGAGTTLIGFLAEVIFSKDVPDFAKPAFTGQGKRGLKFGMQPHGIGMSIQF